MQVQNLTPKKAFQKIQSNPKALFVDVRSSMEFLFVGHPVGAKNIAWIDEPDWQINPHFSQEITKLLSKNQPAKDTEVVLICRSGVRSLEAGKVLIEAGFQKVFNVKEGFEGDLDEQSHRGFLGGWRYRGLPWGQC